MESAGVDEMGKRQRQACIAGRFVPPCAQGADGTSEKGIFDSDPEMVKGAGALRLGRESVKGG